MQKRPAIIIVLILLVATLIAAACLLPWPTRIDQTLTMVKIDSDGNEIGTFDVHFRGKHLNYLFQEDRVLLTIDPFDNITDIKTSDSGNTKDGIIYRFGKEHGTEYWKLNLDGRRTSDGTFQFVFLDLYFSEEFDCFALYRHDGDGQKWSYVTSVSGKYTTQEIIEYFNGLVPG